MVKQIALILCFSIQSVNCFAVNKGKDSFGRKNLIEWGATCVNLFDHNGFEFTHPITNYYLSYTRVLTKYHWFIKADYNTYAVGNNYNMGKNQTKNKGDVIYTEYKFIRFSIGKVWAYKKWRFAPYIGLGKRWGFGDYVFWDYRNQLARVEPYYAVSHYKSPSIGLGCSVNYIIRRKITFGFESHLDYFFQKNNLVLKGNDNAKYESNYQPNINSLTCHFKIGFLF